MRTRTRLAMRTRTRPAVRTRTRRVAHADAVVARTRTRGCCCREQGAAGMCSPTAGRTWLQNRDLIPYCALLCARGRALLCARGRAGQARQQGRARWMGRWERGEGWLERGRESSRTAHAARGTLHVGSPRSSYIDCLHFASVVGDVILDGLLLLERAETLWTYPHTSINTHAPHTHVPTREKDGRTSA